MLPVRFFLILPFCACKVKSDLVYFSSPCAYYGQRDRWQTLLRCFVRRMIHTQVRVSVRRRASPERQKAGRMGVPRPADPGGARKAAAWFLRSLLFRPHRLTGRAVFSGKSRGSVDASPALAGKNSPSGQSVRPEQETAKKPGSCFSGSARISGTRNPHSACLLPLRRSAASDRNAHLRMDHPADKASQKRLPTISLAIVCAGRRKIHKV